MSRVGSLILRATAPWPEAIAPVLAYAREVVAVLNNGFMLRDQLRIVRDITIDTGAFPVTVTIPANARPLSVVLVRAVEQTAGDGVVFSGGHIEWDAVPSGVRIRDVSALAALTKYDAVIAVVE